MNCPQNGQEEQLAVLSKLPGISSATGRAWVSQEEIHGGKEGWFSNPTPPPTLGSVSITPCCHPHHSYCNR